MSVLVSISCIAYNQEKYIAQAIEGFLLQRTNFKYEILIHDDASTDRTADIIREYEHKFPDIIKPVYQTVNQYSQGIKVGTKYNLPRAQGKYIAFCEGDDYWIDPLKLQKQVDYMEKHPECSMCFHAVQVVKNDRRPTGRIIKPYVEDRIVPIEDLIVGGGAFLSMNSIVYPRRCMENPPDFYLQAPVGDAPLTLYLASQGTVCYFKDVMSAYRTGVAGSWISRVSSSRAKEVEVRTRIIDMTNEFNKFTEYRYADSIKLRQNENELLLLLAEGNVNLLKEDKYRKFYEQLGIYVIAMIYLKKYCPSLYNRLRKYKNHIVSKVDPQN